MKSEKLRCSQMYFVLECQARVLFSIKKKHKFFFTGAIHSV